MGNDSKLPLKREFSAGGAVYKKLDGGGVVWLLGKHSGYHKWVLPKGMIEEGEKGIETAVRETREEMGVEARVVGQKPIHKDQYFFVAELKTEKQKDGETAKQIEPVRRVKTYQEDPNFEAENSHKVRVFKTVSFYLMEYVGGDPKDHDWEMEKAGWFLFEEASDKLAFLGEREALEKAQVLLKG